MVLVAVDFDVSCGVTLDGNLFCGLILSEVEKFAYLD